MLTKGVAVNLRKFVQSSSGSICLQGETVVVVVVVVGGGGGGGG